MRPSGLSAQRPRLQQPSSRAAQAERLATALAKSEELQTACRADQHLKADLQAKLGAGAAAAVAAAQGSRCVSQPDTLPLLMQPGSRRRACRLPPT